MVWTRVLGAVFGNTVLASSTVLTAFMLGLALGSTLLGQWADRSSRPLMLAAVALTPSNIFWDVVNSYHAPSRIAFFREHSTGTPARTSPLQ